MLDPSVTLLQGKNKDLKILSDTRTQHDTLEVFGGEYPGGALYTRADWIAAHQKRNAGADQRDPGDIEVDPLHTPRKTLWRRCLQSSSVPTRRFISQR